MKEYDIIEEMKAPITQTPEWKKLQDDLGETSFFEQGNGYQYLAIKKSTPVGNYLYLPYGPVFQAKQGYENSLKSLKNLAARTQAIFTRIEPQNLDFIAHLPKNAHKSHDLNPKDTWVLDLTTPELKSILPSRLLRYHRNAAKNGLKIETSHNPEDIRYLLKLQKQTAKAKNISTYSEEYLATELSQPFATLYLVKYQDKDKKDREEVVAAGLVFDDRTTRYNLQGAQNDLGRKLHATGVLTIELIQDAADQGIKEFDFWGIAPDGAPQSHPWAGFTEFKKSFTGSPRHYAGTYDLVNSPTKYRLYQILRRVNRFLKK